MIVGIIKTRVVGILFLAMAVGAPAISYARGEGHHEEHHYYHYRDYPRFGFHVSIIPSDCFSFSFGRSRYYYYDGLYYADAGPDYVIAPPPIGAVVRVIPPDFQPLVINGVTYYTDNGIYYVLTPSGYQVVPQPGVTVVQVAPATPVVANSASQEIISPTGNNAPAAPVTITTPASSAASEESFTVNIPNDKGGYTAVTLKRSAKGFVGPQGEFYAEFPKVSQLKVMYGK